MEDFDMVLLKFEGARHLYESIIVQDCFEAEEISESFSRMAVESMVELYRIRFGGTL